MFYVKKQINSINFQIDREDLHDAYLPIINNTLCHSTIVTIQSVFNSLRRNIFTFYLTDFLTTLFDD